MEEFYSFEITSPRRINVYTLAKAMGLDIRYAHLSKNIKVKVRSKLFFDSRDITVYDEYGNEKIIAVTKPTMFVDESIKDKVEEYNAIVHECVHDYLHNLFYELQISAVDMHKENLDSSELISYPMITNEIINFQN